MLYSIKGTILEEQLFAEFDEFMAMTTEENSESDSDTEEPPFEKITFNTDYKIKTSLKEPPMDLELKPLPEKLRICILGRTLFSSIVKEIVKLLGTGIIDPIADSPWVSPIHYVPKKGGVTVVTNKKDELVPIRTVTVGECMLAIFHDMIEESIEVFMDDFSIFGISFDNCLKNLEKMLQHYKDANLVLN
ncbi:hypothetical protein Tco_1497743 [Tanacetum coccineum]